VYEEDLLTDKRRSIRISQKLLSVLGVVTHSCQRNKREITCYLVGHERN
jgi:hypothetical protein